MKKGALCLIILFLVTSLASGVLAAEPQHIIVNSEDWRDVYSVMLFSSLKGVTGSFLVSDRHATLILNSIGSRAHIWLFESRRVPFFVGFASVARGKGYSVEEFSYTRMNLELAKRAVDDFGIRNFIIIDDSYGYNAVSVAPYAVVSESYVLFADSDNLRDVESFLSGVDVGDILIYGHVDRAVRNALQQYSPEIINMDGDRFENNMEIVTKYLELKPGVKQAVLTNGEFLEREIMLGVEPVIFIGSGNVPDNVRTFIRDIGIDIGVLIGNELVGAATTIRRQVGISVLEKSAQGARADQGSISQVEALDMFYLPTYILNLELVSIVYNRATNQIEVKFRNTVDQAIYFKGTYSVRTADGDLIRLGDIDPVFIDGREMKTLAYDVDTLNENNLTIDAYVIYGESKGSLEKIISRSIRVSTVQILDNCNLELNSLKYSPQRDLFYVGVKNIADVTCYADAELIDVVVAGARVSFNMDGVKRIDSGETKDLKIKAALESEDFEDNELVKVRVYYGEREDSLVKTIEDNFKIEFVKADYILYVLVVLLVLLLLLSLIHI